MSERRKQDLANGKSRLWYQRDHDLYLKTAERIRNLLPISGDANRAFLADVKKRMDAQGEVSGKQVSAVRAIWDRARSG